MEIRYCCAPRGVVVLLPELPPESFAVKGVKLAFNPAELGCACASPGSVINTRIGTVLPAPAEDGVADFKRCGNVL